MDLLTQLEKKAGRKLETGADIRQALREYDFPKELKQSLVLSADLDFDLQRVADEYVRVLNEKAPKFRTIAHSIREPTSEEIVNCKKHFQVGEIVRVDDHWETHACNGVKKRIFVLDMEAIELPLP